MKKFLVTLGLLGVLIGCTSAEIEKKDNVKIEEKVPAQKDMVSFKREDNNQVVTLESSNLYETGVLTVGDKKIDMHRAICASGMRLVGDTEKAEIHFKRDEGILVLDGKEIQVSIIK